MSNTLTQRNDRERSRNSRKKQILGLKGLAFDIHEFTPYQYRINGRLDIYPTHGRWHDIKINARGEVGPKGVRDFVVAYFQALNKVVPPEVVPPDGKDTMIRMLEELLVKGYRLVESSVSHVSHGGLSQAEAQAWLDEVRENGIAV